MSRDSQSTIKKPQNKLGLEMRNKVDRTHKSPPEARQPGLETVCCGATTEPPPALRRRSGAPWGGCQSPALHPEQRWGVASSVSHPDSRGRHRPLEGPACPPCLEAACAG